MAERSAAFCSTLLALRRCGCAIMKMWSERPLSGHKASPRRGEMPRHDCCQTVFSYVLYFGPLLRNRPDDQKKSVPQASFRITVET